MMRGTVFCLDFLNLNLNRKQTKEKHTFPDDNKSQLNIQIYSIQVL